MHELSVAVGIVELCAERARQARVRNVRLQIGVLTCIQPESLQFCFEVAAEGTVLQGASIDIELQPAHSRCRDCGQTVELREAFAVCECGSANLEPPQGGDALRVISIEIEEAA